MVNLQECLSRACSCEAEVGEIIRDSVAPLGGVWGQDRISKETGETRGGRDGLRSHIEVLGF